MFQIVVIPCFKFYLNAQLDLLHTKIVKQLYCTTACSLIMGH